MKANAVSSPSTTWCLWLLTELFTLAPSLNFFLPASLSYVNAATLDTWHLSFLVSQHAPGLSPTLTHSPPPPLLSGPGSSTGYVQSGLFQMPLAEFSLISKINLLNPYPGTAMFLFFLCQFLNVNQGDPELLRSSRPFKMGSCFADLRPYSYSVLRIPRQARSLNVATSAWFSGSFSVKWRW